MYTTKKSLGKFEACESQLTAQVLYAVMLVNGVNDEFGDCDGPHGWNGLVLGKRYGFLLHEDNYGFFTYEVTDKAKARATFDKFVREAKEEEALNSEEWFLD